MNILTFGGFFELIKISSILIVILCFLLQTPKYFRRVGTNIMFVSSIICACRLIIPFHLPMTFEIACPFINTNALSIFTLEIFGGLKILHLLLLFSFSIALSKIYFLFIEYNKFTSLLWSLSKTPSTKKFDAIIAETLSEFNLKSDITIIISENIDQSFVVGFKKVFIALPSRHYSKRQLRFILLHELNHVKHKDFLWKLFFEILSAFYWWFPLIYVFRNSFSKLLEIRNDMRCIDGMTAMEQHSYLDCLLQESENKNTCKCFTLPFSASNKSFLKKRFIILLDNQEKNIKAQIFILIILVVLFLLSISISLIPISL